MGLSVKQQTAYWLAGFAAFLAVLWLLGNVLLPFVIGIAIAYFLDPVADRLESAGLSRALSIFIITAAALLALAALVVALVPLLGEQLTALAVAVPGYLKQLQAVLSEYVPGLMGDESALRRIVASLVSSMEARSGELASMVLASAFTVVDAVLIIVVAPVVAVYMLLDWDRMIAVIDSWLPRDHQATIRKLAGEVDSVLAGFVRGQLAVCGILAVWYAVALMVVGLQFGLVVGLIAGLLTIIPFVGAIIGGVLSVGLALFQFWGEPGWIAAVAAVFVVGQLVEGNVLTPKLVGQSVGLHPVWLLFALSAFGSLFGFTGLLVAVPTAAAIGVLSRFCLRQYLAGRLYRGFSDTS